MAEVENIRTNLKAAADIDPLQNIATFEKKGEKAERALILTVKGRGVDTKIKPTDKLNRVMWNATKEDLELMERGETLALKTEPNGSTKEATILFRSYYANPMIKEYFERLDKANLQYNLEPYDFEVCVAAAALYNTVGEYISLSQIHYTMGYDTAANNKQLLRMKASIEKMRSITISIDNTPECIAFNTDGKEKVKKFVYTGAPMPSESLEGYVNGQFTDAIVHLFRLPPPVAFAISRNQIATTPRKLDNYPLDHKNKNIWLHKILVERIRDIKNGRAKSNKILLATLMKEENLNITSRNGKSRLKKDIVSLLDHYKKTGYIRGYKIEGDDFRIIV